MKEERRVTIKALQDVWNGIKEEGFYEPFQTIGLNLSLDSALSTWGARTIRDFRASKDRVTAIRAQGYMAQRIENLGVTRALIQETIRDHDKKALWEEFTTIVRSFDVQDMKEVLRSDFGLHGFPIVIESAGWNAHYMQTHGVRAYYTYTDEYLARVEETVYEAQRRFNQETRSGKQESAWVEMIDLVGIEVAMHCNVCRIAISFILGLREMKK